MWKLFRRDDAVRKGASEVEAAYLAWTAEMADMYGYDPEEYQPKQYSLRRLGMTEQGTLWCAHDEDYFWPSVFILDSGSGAEVFLAKSKDGDELALSEKLADAGLDMDALAADPAGELLKYLAQTVEKQTYRVVKATAEQQYTLGVAYPVDEVDSHGDYTDAVELEKAAWDFMASGQVLKAGAGTDHAEGTDLAGTPVESYIYRGPDWIAEDGETVIAKSGDWMLGVVWDDAAWERIKSGELTGYSIQGMAVVEDE